MKKIIVIILALVLAAPLFSQVKFGLKAGISTDFTFTNLDLSQATVDVVLQKAKEAEWGFQGGAFMRASFSGFYLQPEILLATASNTLSYEGVVDGQPVDELLEQKFTKLNIPILLGFKMGPVRLNAGPAASILITKPADMADIATYKTATFGYQAGIGLDLFKKLTLDVRYEGNLNQFGDGITIGGETVEFDDRTGALILHVGLIF
jgi:hypothetical protein